MPMEFIERILLYISMSAFVCMVIGLVKPWIMLWWEDTQTRKKVILVYGSTATITFLLYKVLDLL